MSCARAEDLEDVDFSQIDLSREIRRIGEEMSVGDIEVSLAVKRLLASAAAGSPAAGGNKKRGADGGQGATPQDAAGAGGGAGGGGGRAKKGRQQQAAAGGASPNDATPEAAAVNKAPVADWILGADENYTDFIKQVTSAPTVAGGRTICLAFHLSGSCKQGTNCPRKASHKTLDAAVAKKLSAWVAKIRAKAAQSPAAEEL
jgi:hypothetical protein